ncbi:hypothetical protein A0H81_03906 [Grifola frondosa]|uniref:Uncharacterized protein n=1 Tax=Grifola frondosa TaxID=5627 RepID=A0A1C7MGZ3_GRIFR|nr:hypothetical protein A0H81_03906 [Grifola frondosa]
MNHRQLVHLNQAWSSCGAITGRSRCHFTGKGPGHTGHLHWYQAVFKSCDSPATVHLPVAVTKERPLTRARTRANEESTKRQLRSHASQVIVAVPQNGKKRKEPPAKEQPVAKRRRNGDVPGSAVTGRDKKPVAKANEKTSRKRGKAGRR